MERLRRFATGTSKTRGSQIAVLVLAGLAAGCTGGPNPVLGPPGPSSAGGSGGPTQPPPAPPTATASSAIRTGSAAPPTGRATAPGPTPRPTRPAVPEPLRLGPVAIPAACELNAPADGLQRAADAGRLPWRLDPTEVVLECLRRDLGTADWRTSRTGEHTVVVAEPRSRFAARFHVDQPARRAPGGIWGITGIDATTALTLPPACLVPDPAALQAAFDQGHQPWRGDPVTNAEVCVRAAYGWTHPHGRLLSAGHVLVVDDMIGEDAEVHGRRWRPGNSPWLVTSVERDIGSD
jgi:hypothetical protein